MRDGERVYFVFGVVLPYVLSPVEGDESWGG